MLPDSVVKDVRGATHVLAYALRTTKLINNRRSHCERELIFVVEEFSDFEIIALYDNKLANGSEPRTAIWKTLWLTYPIENQNLGRGSTGCSESDSFLDKKFLI